MNRFHLLTISAFACGVASFLAAAEGFAAANTCTPLDVSPAVCQAAHSTGPVANSGGAYCLWNYNFLCVTMYDCAPQYGVAFPGVCEHTGLGGSAGTSLCVEGHHLTLLEIKYYNAFCMNAGYTCGCYWTVSNQTPSQYMSVCDCHS